MDATATSHRERLRAEVLASTPWWYSPWLHVALPAAFGLGLIAAALWVLRAPTWLELGVVPLTWVVANATEWRAHRSILHRRVPGLGPLFEQHTVMHHALFVKDDMAVRSPRELRLVLLPSFGIVLIALVTSPVTAALWLQGQRNAAALFLATCMAYVLSYEWLHLAYHAPADSFVGRRALIRLLRRHHATHHAPELMQAWNFNVTVPLWDWLRGTIYVEEKR